MSRASRLKLIGWAGSNVPLSQRQEPAAVSSPSGSVAWNKGSWCAVPRASVADGASFSVMVGVGETYLPAFALALGMGEITAGRVTFGPENVEPILGVTALESVGITIDPANRTLKHLPAIPLKQGSNSR